MYGCRKSGGPRGASTSRRAARLPDRASAGSDCKHCCAAALRVELLTTRRPVGVLTLKRRSRSPVAQLFIDGIRQVAKPLASDC